MYLRGILSVRHNTQSGLGKRISLAFNPMTIPERRLALHLAYGRLELSRHLSFEQVMANGIIAIWVIGAISGSGGPVAFRHQRASRTAARFRASPAVPAGLARKRGCRTIQPQGDRRGFDSHLQLRLDHRSLFNTQLSVAVSLATLSPRNVALGF